MPCKLRHRGLQQIQEYVSKAAEGATSADPFEVRLFWDCCCGVISIAHLCWLHQGMSPEEINSYLERQQAGAL